MTLILSGDITLRRTWQPMDPDAAAYITAVETADGQALEEKVKIAIDNFVLGCKADGIWSAIKASCILAGARTLNGALVPLAGTAPSNFNFVAGDYNRKTGLIGDASSKYLNANRATNADPQNSFHMAVIASVGSGGAIIGGDGNNSINNAGTDIRFRSASQAMPLANNAGFIGGTRESALVVKARIEAITYAYSPSSIPPGPESIYVFRRNAATPLYSNVRLAFYSIGEALNLAKLDARVTDLINKFAEVIP